MCQLLFTFCSRNLVEIRVYGLLIPSSNLELLSLASVRIGCRA